MKTEHKVFLLCLLGGVAFWVMDAAADHLVFHEGAFLDLLILDIPGHGLYDRGTAFLVFFVLGLVVAIFAARRRRAEGVLRRSESFLQTVIDAIPEVTLTIGLDHRVVLANRAARDMAGGKDPVAEGMMCYALSHGRDTPCEGEAESCPLEQVRAEKQPAVVVHTHVDADGNERIVEVTAAPIFDEAGEVVQVIEACRDITDRKRAEEQAENLAKFPSESPDPVLRIAKDGEVLYANAAAATLLDAFGGAVGRAAPDPWRQAVEDALASGERQQHDVPQAGRIFSFMTIPVVGADYLNVYGRDVTERRQAEARAEGLAKFPSENPYPVLRIADDGTVLYANAASLPLIGDWECEVGRPAPEPWRQLVERVLATGLPDALEEPHGQHTVLFAAAPVPDKGYVNVYGVDITARKRAREERKRLIAELETKNAELERFTYTVSHDLKGPLITIKGFAGLLEKDIANGDAETTEQDLARIKKAADRMHQLLDELLDLSRVGRVVGPPEDVPLSDLAREAMELMALRAGESGVEIHIPPDLPVVRGDRPRLLSVMQNLMDNAVKFMGDQVEPRIEIGGRHDGGETLCWVRDNGIGIDPRYHDRVFGLFDQLHRGTSEGTGIGLAITKRVVEVHGGRIWLESEGQGRGSTFCFALPRKGGSANGEDQ